MKAKLEPDGEQLVLVLHAEDIDDDSELRRAFKRGHLHFTCKALLPPNPKALRKIAQHSALILKPSVIRWRRPK